MTSYWCELAWLGGDSAVADVQVEVDGDRIRAVTPATPHSAGATRLPGLTLPGLANAHSHAFHRALRGRTQVGGGSFWTWRTQMYAAAQRLQPENYLRLARAVYGEMALAGITSVGEFHYLHHDVAGTPYAEPNAMGAVLAQAAAQAGIRITVLDTCYLHGGLDAGGHTALNDVQRRFSDGDAASWATRASAAAASLESSICRVGAAIHSVRAVDPAAIATVASWADERNAPLHAHVSEQQVENDQSLAAYGVTPAALLADNGALHASFTAVHATHLTAADIGLLGSAASTVCLCPTTERDLADGIGPAGALCKGGARLALGSDSQAVIDLLEETRAVELNERLASHVRGTHDAPSLLRAACANGQRSLGWHEVGELRAGALADFITVRLDSVRTTGGSAGSALETAVFAATADDVSHVVVGGEVVVLDGRHVRFDVATEMQAAISELMDEE